MTSFVLPEHHFGEFQVLMMIWAHHPVLRSVEEENWLFYICCGGFKILAVVRKLHGCIAVVVVPVLEAFIGVVHDGFALLVLVSHLPE